MQVAGISPARATMGKAYSISTNAPEMLAAVPASGCPGQASSPKLANFQAFPELYWYLGEPEESNCHGCKSEISNPPIQNLGATHLNECVFSNPVNNQPKLCTSDPQVRAIIRVEVEYVQNIKTGWLYSGTDIPGKTFKENMRMVGPILEFV